MLWNRMAHRNLVILTGAGISAESGVPTFRADDGLWMGHRIEDGIFRDRVESNAFDGNAFERTAGIEGFDNMP